MDITVEVTPQMWLSLGILAFFIIGLVLAKWPMGLTSMTCCVALAVLKVVPVSDAFCGLTNKLLIMLACLYVVSGAFSQTSLMDKIKGILLKLQDQKGMGLVLGIFGMTILMGQFLPSAVLVPLMATFMTALSVDSKSSVTPSRLMMAVTGLSPMWQQVLPIGTGLTMYATFNAYYEAFVTNDSQLVTVMQPFLFRIFPCTFVLIWSIIGYRILPKVGPSSNLGVIGKTDQQTKTAQKKHFTDKQEKIVYIVFAAVMIALILSIKLGDLMYVIPALGVLVLAYTKTMTMQEIKVHMCSDTVFLIVGILSISSALNSTGAGTFLGKTILSLLGKNPSPLTFLILVCVVSVIMTSLMSNLATAAVLIPVAAVTAITAGWSPQPYAISIYTMAFCAILLPSASSAAAVGHAAAGYNLKDSLKFTIPFALFGILGCVVAFLIFY